MMTIKNLSDGINRFIETEILPQADIVEKSALIAAKVFGLFNIEDKLNSMLQSSLFQNSNIWINEEKTEVSLILLKEFCTKLLSSMGDRYVFEGYTYQTGIKDVILFKGIVINSNFIETLFKNIEG